jgi:hypothetical protein
VLPAQSEQLAEPQARVEHQRERRRILMVLGALGCLLVGALDHRAALVVPQHTVAALLAHAHQRLDLVTLVVVERRRRRRRRLSVSASVTSVAVTVAPSPRRCARLS